MMLYWLLYLHLTSSVLSQRVLVVNKRARQRIRDGGGGRASATQETDSWERNMFSGKREDGERQKQVDIVNIHRDSDSRYQDSDSRYQDSDSRYQYRDSRYRDSDSQYKDKYSNSRDTGRQNRDRKTKSRRRQTSIPETEPKSDIEQELRPKRQQVNFLQSRQTKFQFPIQWQEFQQFQEDSFQRQKQYTDSNQFRDPISVSAQSKEPQQFHRPVQFPQPYPLFDDEPEQVSPLSRIFDDEPEQVPPLPIIFDNEPEQVPIVFDDEPEHVSKPTPFLPTPLPEIEFHPPQQLEFDFVPIRGPDLGELPDQHKFSTTQTEEGDGGREIQRPGFTPATELTTQRATVTRRQKLHRKHQQTQNEEQSQKTGSTKHRSRARSRFRKKSSGAFQTLSEPTTNDLSISRTRLNRRISRVRLKPRRRVSVEKEPVEISHPQNLPRNSPARTITSRPNHELLTNAVPDTQRRISTPKSRFRSRIHPDPKAGKPQEKPRRPKSTKIFKLKKRINSLARVSPRNTDRITIRKINKSPPAFVTFPKRNLFPHLPKIKVSKEKSLIQDNIVSNSGRLPKSSPPHSLGNLSQDIRPTRTIVKEDLTQDNYYDNVNIQSSREEERDGVITVTHKTSLPTVYTIIENKETKKLYAEFETTSLQIVDVNDLTSTNVNGVGVVYAHVVTSQPQFGVKEYHYDAIHPSTVEHLIESRLVIGGRKTSITNTIMSTHYNVQTVTNRVTETPSIDSKTLAGTNPLQALVQNILATLLGKNLLLAAGGGGDVTPETEVVTHTRSYLTSFISSQTIVIPVTLRGQEVYKTVTDAVTQTVTTTQYSRQTIVRQKQAQPAPTRRVQPSWARTPPSPAPVTSLVTHPVLAISTVTTLDTSSLVVTLAGRTLTTTFNQPKTQVVTVTSYSTETIVRPARTATVWDNIQPNVDLLQRLHRLLS